MSDVSVRRRPNGCWEVRWRQGGRRHSRSFDRKGDADRLATDVRRRQQLGHTVELDRGAETLAEWMETYWTSYAIPNLAPATRASYKQTWGKHLLPRVGSYELREITPGVVEDLHAQLHAAGVGDPTIRRALVILQGILKRAVVRGRLDYNPVVSVDKPPQRRGVRFRPLAPSTVEAIRRNVSRRDATLVSVIAYAGLRPAEAYELRWRDISRRSLAVHAPKTHRDRIVKLLAPLAQDLAEWRLQAGRPAGTELVFPRTIPGPWATTDWRNWRRRVYQPAAHVAGVTDDMRAYRLRGSFASLLLWEGRSLTYVAEQMGHSVAVLSDHYAGVLEELEDAPRVPADQVVRQARSQAGGRTVDARDGSGAS